MPYPAARSNVPWCGAAGLRQGCKAEYSSKHSEDGRQSEAHPMSSATPASCRICVPVISIAKPRNSHMIITMTMNSPSERTAQHTTPHSHKQMGYPPIPTCPTRYTAAVNAQRRLAIERTQGGLLLRHAAAQ